ncbi:substrate-binding periplasmic protein [Aliamphritea spongicola]|uniref:substrate-binding periplasmic protein n=1 Tax=Aliamphritea spongicola TaxID=707589 RepID=UPI00196B3D0F|nr:transporter substrate-binding domain-containing protein [Aliamphritea spongicola]MBN3564862.1 transporter substrate-binding domain-containing protein [Aliamphritea spongicola]
MLLSTVANADSPRPVLTACGHPFYPPVSWVSEGQLKGLAPQLTRQLFAELGYDVQLIADTNWKRCLLEARLGNIDIVVAAYRIASRESYLAFSEQYIIADEVRIFVNSDADSPITGMDDLPGKTVGLLLGDSFGDRFDAFLQTNSHIEYVSRNQQNFSKLANQRIDYMPIGWRSGMLQTRKLGFENHVMPLREKIASEYYYLALSKAGNLSQHLPYINQRLQELHKSNRIRNMIRSNSLEYLHNPL